jgi:hypothetical protein
MLTQRVVVPLNKLGIRIDLHEVQAALVSLPILLLVLAFVVAGWKKRRRMKDAGF